MIVFWERWRKYARLGALARRLGGQALPGSLEQLFEWGDAQDRGLKDLFELIESDQLCLKVLAKYDADTSTLKALYTELLEAGAGQWASRRYVPCYALAEPWCLEYLLARRRLAGIVRETDAFKLIEFYAGRKDVQWLLASI